MTSYNEEGQFVGCSRPRRADGLARYSFDVRAFV